MMNVCIMRMLQLVNNFVYKLVVKKICIMYNNQEIIVQMIVPLHNIFIFIITSLNKKTSASVNVHKVMLNLYQIIMNVVRHVRIIHLQIKIIVFKHVQTHIHTYNKMERDLSVQKVVHKILIQKIYIVLINVLYQMLIQLMEILVAMFVYSKITQHTINVLYNVKEIIIYQYKQMVENNVSKIVQKVININNYLVVYKIALVIMLDHYQVLLVTKLVSII